MVNRLLKVIGLSIFVLVLAMPSAAQNTKGDKPSSSRESRFKKSIKKKKPAKRVKSRKTSSLRDYSPRPQRKGGENAGRAVSKLRNSKPSEKPRKIWPQSGMFVNNPSKTPRKSEANKRSTSASQRRVSVRSTVSRSRNVYPQSGRYVNYSSSRQRPPRKNQKVVPRSASSPFIRRRSNNSWTQFPRPKHKKEKAYVGDISGRRIRTKNFETKRPAIIQVPAGGRFGTVRSRSGYPRSTPLSATPRQKQRNVYTPNGNYSNYISSRPKAPRAVSNRSTLARLKRLQTPDKRPRRKLTVVPRSASRPFIKRKSTNTWAQFPRPKHKGERATTKDIAGKPLLKKNYETPRPGVIPPYNPYQGRKRIGDRPYQGSGGGFLSRTRQGRPWKGDITNRRIRRNFTSKKGTEGKAIITPEKRRIGMRDQGEGFTGRIKFRRPLKGGGTISGRRWNNNGNAIPPRTPGIGAQRIGKYQGNIKGRKGFVDQGEGYTGRIKSRKPLKGGGSISGRVWNNKGTAVPGRTPGIGAKGIDKFSGNLRRGGKGFADQGEGFPGSIKRGRPLKGGGSVSGRVWNNKGNAVPGRTPGIGAKGIDKFSGNIRRGGRGFADQGEGFPGNIKRGKPLKGGGSVSGHVWNNQGKAIPGRTPGIGADRIEKFQGNIKTGRPLKGGGSVSGRLWNNNRTPIPVKPPSKAAAKAGGFPGKFRMFDLKPGFRDQGEGYTGSIKAKRPLKGGGSISGKLWNNKETPIAVRNPESEQGGEFRGHIKRKGYIKNPNSSDLALKKLKPKTTEEVAGLQFKVKRSRYVDNPNSSGDALKKLRPGKNTYQVGDLQIKIKQHPFDKRKNAPDGSLPGLKPSKSSLKAYEFARGIKRSWDYVKNPNSSDASLKIREPGKAFGKATDYQGNIKMKKFDLFGKSNLHPDAKFVKTNKNNVDGERDMLTNLKLWWSRLFKKNETQPSHLKEKGGKPRYDKGEQGLWYD